MKIIWSPLAIEHLGSLRSYIAEESRDAAERVGARIVGAAELLRIHPRAGRTGRSPGTRELVITGTPYVVAYRVREDRIELLAIFHGRQRWPEEL